MQSPLSRYLKHWLLEVDEHSLHAPFIYNFHTGIIRKDLHLPDFDRVESIRDQMLASQNSVEVVDLGAGSRVNKGRTKEIRHIARYELSKPKFCRLIYRIIQSINAEHMVEIGTSLGINTMYMSMAAPQATIHTLEGCPNTAALAEANFEKTPSAQNIRMHIGDANSLLPQVLSGLPSIDFAYLDANHTYAATVDYFSLLKTFCHSQSILMIDDIHWSAGMDNAWDEIIRDPKITLSLDLYDVGILFFREGLPKSHYRLKY